MMKKIFAFLLSAIIVLTAGCLNPVIPQKPVKLDLKGFKKAAASRFGFLGAENEGETLSKAGVHWNRPHPGPFIWNSIDEDGRGENFDFSEADSYIDKAQEYGFVTLATIWPFNQKDAERYYKNKPEAKSKVFQELPNKLYPPGNISAYKRFVRALVERYDGDKNNDYENLKYPIKYWEASNEPEMQNEELTFFQGTPADYYKILKATDEAVKEADSNAFVLHAGAAGMGQNQKLFWEKFFSIKNVANHFDIANIHSIGASDTFWINEFSALLKEKGIQKEIWITEANITSQNKPAPPLRKQAPNTAKKPPPPPKLKAKLTPKEHAKKIKKAFEYAFNNGAEKIFYTTLRSNDVDPGAELIINNDESNSPAWEVFKRLIKKYGQ